MTADQLPGDNAVDSPPFRGPLVISVIAVPGAGQIGLTNCPGRHHLDSQQRRWHRDLREDLKAISQWGAHGIVSLNEAHEFPLLGVEDFAQTVQASELKWFHLPVPDMQPPGDSFSNGWREHGAQILDILAGGNRLLVHCAAGLGRSGMVAAKLLTTFGMQADPAISLVRERRPGAIETQQQEQYVLHGPPLSTDR